MLKRSTRKSSTRSCCSKQAEQAAQQAQAQAPAQPSQAPAQPAQTQAEPAAPANNDGQDKKKSLRKRREKATPAPVVPADNGGGRQDVVEKLKA